MLLSEEQIANLPLDLIKSIAEHQTIATTKEGVQILQTRDMVEEWKKQMEALQNKIQKQRKPKRKYATNYTPPKRRHRKK